MAKNLLNCASGSSAWMGGIPGMYGGTPGGINAAWGTRVNPPIEVGTPGGIVPGGIVIPAAIGGIYPGGG